MFSLQIHDEQLAHQLQQIAERENRSIEAVLKTLVETYTVREDRAAVWRRVRGKAYIKARAYWESVGDTAKAALTDAELDEQFAFFDPDGIPRLKSEVDSLEPPVGSLAYAAKLAREANIRTGAIIDSGRTDEILNDEFADYLLDRMKDDDATSG
jgi:hypothetical protein